jgi:serine/threonine protein kinase
MAASSKSALSGESQDSRISFGTVGSQSVLYYPISTVKRLTSRRFSTISGLVFRKSSSRMPRLHTSRQSCAEEYEQYQLGKPVPKRYYCDVVYGTLLKDGRSAFMMVKEEEDLRSVIDRNMRTNGGGNGGPFQKNDREAEMIMYHIALGMDWLHSLNIVHRDLKASNVHIEFEGFWESFIADFECSIGVVRTGFWRAPEILQAIKDHQLLQRPEIFSKKVDVYAYGMTCYEILTRNLPFEGNSVRI